MNDKMRPKMIGGESEENHNPIAEARRIPLKLLVLSELTPRDLQTGTSSISKRMRIDKDSFRDVMSELATLVTISVPNRLGNTPEELIVSLPLRDINSFRPESIAENVPDLRDLLEVRVLLTELRDGRLSWEQFRDQLDRTIVGSEIMAKVRAVLFEPRPPRGVKDSKPKPREDTLSELFEIVEVPGAIPSTASEAVDHIISLITSPKAAHEPIDTKALDTIIAELDALLGAQVNEILHHPEFSRLESTWRGLKFLIDRTDFRENIQIEVMSVPKDSLRDAFHRYVYQLEYDRVSDVPISAVVADYEFDRSALDMELLSSLAVSASDIQVPFISSVGLGFLGMESADELYSISHISKLFDTNEYIKWNGFRQSEPSRWVTLAFNRFLLRLPYGDNNRVKKFNFHEAGFYRLWGNPVWGVGSLLTSSFAKTGWPTEISGARDGAIMDLPVWEYKTKSGEKVYIPLETLIPSQAHLDLVDNGIAALTCRANSDSAIMLSAPSAHIPERYADDNLTRRSVIRATLPYQLLAARVAHYVSLIQAHIIPGNTPEGIERDLEDALSRFVCVKGSSAGSTIRVKVSQNQDRPDYHDIILYIYPERGIMGGMADMELRLRVHI